jgi:Helix-turn-helix domain
MKNSKSVRPSANPPARPSTAPGAIREPIYLASQLASICDVDLKTIHNWCDRNEDPDAPAELESFRTPGGHLRFRHSAVVRFLSRWGYPIPDELLTDRPHLMVVEPDTERRAQLIEALSLVRPGRESDEPGKDDGKPAHSDDGEHLGLYASAKWYVHLWGDAYAALISAGERAGAGAPMDLAITRLPMDGIDATAWRAALLSRPETASLRFVLIDPTKTALDRNVVGMLESGQFDALRALLDTQAQELGATIEPTPTPARRFEGSIARRERIKIPPREPIYVASQVAHIWNVDLKTVHNWVEKGDIEAFSTPGRHLRFRRRSLLHFLRRYNMAIPPEIAPVRPRVSIIDTHVEHARKLAGTLSTSFEVQVITDPTAALVDLGAQCAGANLIDALIVTLPAAGVDAERWIRAVARHEDTRYTSIVALSRGESNDEAHRWQKAGALATVFDADSSQIAMVLERALGVAV